MTSFADMVKSIMGSTLWVPFCSILASILASLLATLLYKTIENSIRKGRKKRWFINVATAFRYGARAAEAKTSSYKQILYVCDYIIDTLYIFLRIILEASVTLVFIVLLRNTYFWGIPLILASVLITIDTMKFISLRKYYNQTIEYIFGKDYIDHEIAGAINYAKNGDVSKDKEFNNDLSN